MKGASGITYKHKIFWYFNPQIILISCQEQEQEQEQLCSWELLKAKYQTQHNTSGLYLTISLQSATKKRSWTWKLFPSSSSAPLLPNSAESLTSNGVARAESPAPYNLRQWAAENGATKRNHNGFDEVESDGVRGGTFGAS